MLVVPRLWIKGNKKILCENSAGHTIWPWWLICIKRDFCVIKCVCLVCQSLHDWQSNTFCMWCLFTNEALIVWSVLRGIYSGMNSVLSYYELSILGSWAEYTWNMNRVYLVSEWSILGMQRVHDSELVGADSECVHDGANNWVVSR